MSSARTCGLSSAGIGLPPLDRFFLEETFAQCDALLQATTTGFEYPRSDLPPWVHFIGSIPPEPSPGFEPPDWWSELEAGHPVVLVTQGTLTTDPDALLRPTLHALSKEACRSSRPAAHPYVSAARRDREARCGRGGGGPRRGAAASVARAATGSGAELRLQSTHVPGRADPGVQLDERSQLLAG